MANDFDNLYDIGNMSDDEIHDLVRQEISDHPDLDPDLIDINVNSGRVSVTGRVGTEQEIQQVEQLLTDRLGVREVSNELVLDKLVRGERSEAADDAFAEDSSANAQLGHGAARTSDEAAHLHEDLDAEQFGSDSPSDAAARGTSYEPPDSPIQQGSYSREDH